MRHSRYAYVHDLCRCEVCTEANRAYHADLCARLGVRDRRDVPHGTESGYKNWLCRCPACRQARRAHNARTRARRKVRAGRPLTELEARALAEAGGA